MSASLFQFRWLLILTSIGLLLPEPSVAQEAGSSEQTKNRVDLPLSTAVVPNKDFGFMRVVPKTAHWDGQDYDIKTGIHVLMAVIKNPQTSAAERAQALRFLGNLGIQLRRKRCIAELISLYPDLQTIDEKRNAMSLLLGASDSRALPLQYTVSVSDEPARVRLAAADALAEWNIRRGVEALITLFPNEEKGPMRTLGVSAMMIFESRNRNKGWGCPIEEIEAPARKLAEQDRDAAIALLLKGYRDWFEANKDRFPDWKPGDPLPVVEEPSPESVHQSLVEDNGWRCDKSCNAPAGYMDCAACCLTRDACMTCFATSLAKATTPEIRKMYCNAAFKP